MSRSATAAVGAVGGLLASAALTALPSPDASSPWLVRALLGSILLAPLGALLAIAVPLALRSARDFPVLGRAWIAIVVILGLVSLRDALSTYRTATRFEHTGDSTEARVVATHPWDHNRISVAYTANGELQESRIRAPGHASALSPGDTLTVYYDRTSPRVALPYWPRWNAQDQTVGILVGVLALPVLAIAVAGTWLRRHPPPTR